MNSSLRDQQCEDNKNEYANQLQKTNDLQVCELGAMGRGGGVTRDKV